MSKQSAKRGKTTPQSTGGSFAPKHQSEPQGSLSAPPQCVGARFGRGNPGPYSVKVTGSMRGEETPAWEGELRRGNKVVAHLHQSGTGGMTMTYFEEPEEAREWGKFVNDNWAFPRLLNGQEYGTHHTEDDVVDALKDEADARAEFRRHSRKGLVVMTADQVKEAHRSGSVREFTVLNVKTPEEARGSTYGTAGAHYFDGNGWTLLNN